MASAEGGSVPSGVGHGEGCPLHTPPQPTKGSGERRELPQRGSGQSPGRKRILEYFEGRRTLIFFTYMTKSGGGGQFALASPAPNSGGETCPPVPP